MMFLLPQAATPTHRVTLRIADALFETWTSAEITRDLTEIAGSFTLEAHDLARAAMAWPGASPRAVHDALRSGHPAVVTIDDEQVLVGWVDDVQLEVSGDKISCTVTGRDRTGDLVDCAAAPEGPAEYTGLDLLQVAQRICRPFGISVRADVPVGARFTRFSLDVAETALAAIEKAARQRAVLVTSDGVGGLVLTRGGKNRGPAPLRLGELVHEAGMLSSMRGRFRDYWVKGQAEKAGGRRATTARLDATAAPLTEAPPPARVRATERAGVVMTGHATDPAVGRYRPTVKQAKTQSGGASVREQAEWAMRVARAKSEQLQYSIADWRAGPERKLWRPNELVLVDDPFADILADRVISAVVYGYGPQGATTKLKLTGPEALDLIREGEERQGQRRRQTGRAQDGTARPLTP